MLDLLRQARVLHIQLSCELGCLLQRSVYCFQLLLCLSVTCKQAAEHYSRWKFRDYSTKLSYAELCKDRVKMLTVSRLVGPAIGAMAGARPVSLVRVPSGIKMNYLGMFGVSWPASYPMPSCQ